MHVEGEGLEGLGGRETGEKGAEEVAVADDFGELEVLKGWEDESGRKGVGSLGGDGKSDGVGSKRLEVLPVASGC